MFSSDYHTADIKWCVKQAPQSQFSDNFSSLQTKQFTVELVCLVSCRSLTGHEMLVNICIVVLVPLRLKPTTGRCKAVCENINIHIPSTCSNTSCSKDHKKSISLPKMWLTHLLLPQFLQIVLTSSLQCLPVLCFLHSFLKEMPQAMNNPSSDRALCHFLKQNNFLTLYFKLSASKMFSICFSKYRYGKEKGC